jgi:hypothetical protein
MSQNQLFFFSFALIYLCKLASKEVFARFTDDLRHGVKDRIPTYGVHEHCR